jgi:radical SAM protein with 4Fe4S-binding SPASM domain
MGPSPLSRIPDPSRVIPLTPEQNVYWRERGYHRGDLVLTNAPEVFAIESTNFCNIKCVMCPRGEPDIMQREIGHMSMDLFRRVMDEATHFGDPTWFHWFGEPLMNPRLFDQLEIAKSKIPQLGMSTNATLLSEKNARRILESRLDTLMIAIDGASKEVYESIRKGSFDFEDVRDNTLRFLRLKREAGKRTPHTILSIIVMDQTSPDLEAFRAFWTEAGADEVLFKPYVVWAGQRNEIFVQLATRARQEALKKLRPHPCKFLWHSLIIAWDGRVLPCCFDYDAKMPLGDLKTQSMMEIWNGAAYVELRRAELEHRNFSPLCANCSDAPGHERDPNWGGVAPTVAEVRQDDHVHAVEQA